MDWPDDGPMLLLMAVWAGETPDVVDGTVTLPGLGVPVNLRSLDELEERGWVEITEAGPRATERGGYWLGVWRDRVVGRRVRERRRRRGGG